MAFDEAVFGSAVFDAMDRVAGRMRSRLGSKVVPRSVARFATSFAVAPRFRVLLRSTVLLGTMGLAVVNDVHIAIEFEQQSRMEPLADVGPRLLPAATPLEERLVHLQGELGDVYARLAERPGSDEGLAAEIAALERAVSDEKARIVLELRARPRDPLDLALDAAVAILKSSTISHAASLPHSRAGHSARRDRTKA